MNWPACDVLAAACHSVRSTTTKQAAEASTARRLCSPLRSVAAGWQQAAATSPVHHDVSACQPAAAVHRAQRRAASADQQAAAARHQRAQAAGPPRAEAAMTWRAAAVRAWAACGTARATSRCSDRPWSVRRAAVAAVRRCSCLARSLVAAVRLLTMTCPSDVHFWFFSLFFCVMMMKMIQNPHLHSNYDHHRHCLISNDFPSISQTFLCVQIF
mmetsp:Transcript_12069/g.20188  ORF Transcript_12069/g.20188 Transcript_12069/m.20188 type:complete len:214 (-) Transcript_12069:2432-3073(-)